MNLLKKTISKSKYFLLALLVAFSFSCSTEDGEDGPQGPAGTDGQDGNANVQTFIFNSPSWSTTTSGMKLNLTGVLTDDVIENDVILTYVKPLNSNEPSMVPAKVFVGWGFNDIYVSYGISTSTTFPSPQHLGIVCFDENGGHTPNANLPDLEWVKVIIIKSTNTTTNTGNGRVANSKDVIMQELNNAGVNTGSYEEVCNYYGITN